MSSFKFYIRFGVHKDRDVIRELNSSIDGVCVPAHIFAYSPEPTVYAALTIDKSYFIDPMTYIYADQDIEDYITVDKKSGSRQFKPSIKKLTDEYALTDFFKERDFARLQATDLNADMISSWCQKNIELQCEKIDSKKDSTIKRYAELFKEMGMEDMVSISSTEHKPMFIVPPYFYFSSLTDPWLEVNVNFAKKTKELRPESDVVPVLLTTSATLSEELLDKYVEAGFKKIFIWLDDLNEKERLDNDGTAHLGKLKNLVSFIEKAKSKEVEVFNLYGSYFSILLGKIGLGGMCNGVFYGEYKSRKANVGGGPQARYYIRKLHEFFNLEQAMFMLNHGKGKTLLDTESEKCMSLIGGKVENIFLFDSDHSLAQRHFVYSRTAELAFAAEKDMKDLLKELTDNAASYQPVLEAYTRNTKKLDYLKLWSQALTKEEAES